MLAKWWYKPHVWKSQQICLLCGPHKVKEWMLLVLFLARWVLLSCPYHQWLLVLGPYHLWCHQFGSFRCHAVVRSVVITIFSCFSSALDMFPPSSIELYNGLSASCQTITFDGLCNFSLNLWHYPIAMKGTAQKSCLFSQSWISC